MSGTELPDQKEGARERSPGSQPGTLAREARGFPPPAGAVWLSRGLALPSLEALAAAAALADSVRARWFRAEVRRRAERPLVTFSPGGADE